MSRVALLTCSVSEEVLQLATHLQKQSVYVVIITDQKNKQRVPNSIPCLAPFERWSALEATRFMSVYLQENFDVLHIVLAERRLKVGFAHFFYAQLMRHFLKRKVVLSVQHADSLQQWRTQALLRFCHIGLFASQSLLMRARRSPFFSADTTAVTEVMPLLALPPTLGSNKLSESSYRQPLQQMLSSLGNFFVLPTDQHLPAWMHYSEFSFVCLRQAGGRRRRVPRNSRVFYLQSLTATEEMHVIEKSQALILYYGDFSLQELQWHRSLSEATRTPLVVSEHQNRIWPGLCWHEHSGWVLPDFGEPVLELLKKKGDLKLRNDYQSYPVHAMVDEAMNQLLRLYRSESEL